jgi:hypothetical protein
LDKVLGPADYVIWLVSFLLEVYVVVWALARRQFSSYIAFNFYMIAAGLQTGGFYYVLHRYGFFSVQYQYAYYYSDSILTILLFFVVMALYQQLFKEMKASRYIRGAAAMLLAATALFSYMVVHQNKDHLTSRFVVALGQNLYFVGVVLTYLLWGAIMKLHETRTRLIQLVLALGIFFSADAAAYALRNLFPALQPTFLHWIPPVVGVWLPLAWAYTFTRIPEEARLVTARLAANHQ